MGDDLMMPVDPPPSPYYPVGGSEGDQPRDRVRGVPRDPLPAPATPDAGDASEDVLILDSETGEHVEAPAAYVAERMAGDASTSASEPLSEDAEALADVLTRAGLGTANGIARAILASDWLAAREAKARAEAGEQIAQAIEAGVLDSHPNEGYKDGFRRAARIAREVTS